MRPAVGFAERVWDEAVQQARRALERAAGQGVLVIGDVTHAVQVTCDVDGVALDAPALSMLELDRLPWCGATGAVISYLRLLGLVPHLVTVVGDDGPGMWLARQHAETPGAVIVDAGRVTTSKHRFTWRDVTVFETLAVADEPIEANLRRQVLDAVERALPHVAAVVACDFGFGLFTPELRSTLVQVCTRAGRPLHADVQTSRGGDALVWSGAEVITPNRGEAMAAWPGERLDDETLAERVRVERQHAVTVLTRGPEGSVIAEASGITNIAAPDVDVVDTSGCGDGLLSGLTAARAGGATWTEAALAGTAVASLVAQRWGNDAFSQAELDAMWPLVQQAQVPS